MNNEINFKSAYNLLSGNNENNIRTNNNNNHQQGNSKYNYETTNKEQPSNNPKPLLQIEAPYANTNKKPPIDSKINPSQSININIINHNMNQIFVGGNNKDSVSVSNRRDEYSKSMISNNSNNNPTSNNNLNHNSYLNNNYLKNKDDNNKKNSTNYGNKYSNINMFRNGPNQPTYDTNQKNVDDRPKYTSNINSKLVNNPNIRPSSAITINNPQFQHNRNNSLGSSSQVNNNIVNNMNNKNGPINYLERKPSSSSIAVPRNNNMSPYSNYNKFNNNNHISSSNKNYSGMSAASLTNLDIEVNNMKMGHNTSRPNTSSVDRKYSHNINNTPKRHGINIHKGHSINTVSHKNMGNINVKDSFDDYGRKGYNLSSRSVDRSKVKTSQQPHYNTLNSVRHNNNNNKMNNDMNHSRYTYNSGILIYNLS